MAPCSQASATCCLRATPRHRRGWISTARHSPNSQRGTGTHPREAAHRPMSSLSIRCSCWPRFRGLARSSASASTIAIMRPKAAWRCRSQSDRVLEVHHGHDGARRRRSCFRRRAGRWITRPSWPWSSAAARAKWPRARRVAPCLATRTSTMSARATSSSPTANGSAANPATRSRRWAPGLSRPTRSPTRKRSAFASASTAETMQDSRTSQLIFGIDELIAFISETITLEPGDVIATGTPPGVGFARKPPVFLQDGDVVEVEMDGLGVLRNPVPRMTQPQPSAAGPTLSADADPAESRTERQSAVRAQGPPVCSSPVSSMRFIRRLASRWSTSSSALAARRGAGRADLLWAARLQRRLLGRCAGDGRHTLDILDAGDGPIVIPVGLVHGHDRAPVRGVALCRRSGIPRQGARACAARTFELTQFLVDVLGKEDVGAAGRFPARSASGVPATPSAPSPCGGRRYQSRIMPAATACAVSVFRPSHDACWRMSTASRSAR